MKKRLGVILALILAICSCFCLVGCNEEVKEYTVTTRVWYANYGNVDGSGTYKENSKCTITAKPKTNSSFMAWMHNNRIVSYDSTYTFDVNNTTDGVYIAIFTLPNIDLVTPSLFVFNSDFTNVTDIALQLKIGASYDYLYEIYNGKAESANEYKIEDITLALPKNNQIICEANLSLTFTADGEEEPSTLSEKTIFTFDIEELITEDFELNIPLGIEGNATIKIEFVNFTTGEEETEPEEPEEPEEPTEPEEPEQPEQPENPEENNENQENND